MIVVKPNILILIAEDISQHLGCYGDLIAHTPFLDQLSKEGMIYHHTNCVSSICSTARTSLALGMYPASLGISNHGTNTAIPSDIKPVSKYIHSNGYFCAIDKTDYNFQHRSKLQIPDGWDAIIPNAGATDSPQLPQNIADTWRKRDDKPFFLMATFSCTHQSQYGYPSDTAEHRALVTPRLTAAEYVDRDAIPIPGYHFDTPQTREIWGQYYETITTMDRMVGETIAHLKNDGLYEDTIIIFLGDNGMGLAGGKCNIWNESITVPLIIRIPERFQGPQTIAYASGAHSYSAVSFIDIAPTIIELAGSKIPYYMQGRNFLSSTTFVKYSYSFMDRIDSTSDFVRAVKSNKYLYIRNFYPSNTHRFSSYTRRMAPYFTESWLQEAQNQYTQEQYLLRQYTYDRKNCFIIDIRPPEELYDLESDPQQLTNLAQNFAFHSLILDFRNNLRDFMFKIDDLGFVPEIEQHRLSQELSRPIYEIFSKGYVGYPFTKLYNMSDKMLKRTNSSKTLTTYLETDDPTFQYWALKIATYFNKQDLLPQIEKLLNNNNLTIKFAAAETIIYLSNSVSLLSKAEKVIEDMLLCEDPFINLEALMCMARHSNMLANLVPHLQKWQTLDKQHYPPEQHRIMTIIEDLSNYYPECIDQPFPYDVPTPLLQQRLLVLRQLKQNNSQRNRRLL